MNNYPKWWNTTVTIYNKYTDPQTNIVTWYRFVVEGAFWKAVGDKIVIDKTVLDTRNIICRLRKHPAFLEKSVWVGIPNDQMSNYFTLAQGDIIIKGEVNDVVNEYESGKRSTDLIKKYKDLDGCLEIRRWANNTGGGRGNEHYLVKGV